MGALEPASFDTVDAPIRSNHYEFGGLLCGMEAFH